MAASNCFLSLVTGLVFVVSSGCSSGERATQEVRTEVRPGAGGEHYGEDWIGYKGGAAAEARSVEVAAADLAGAGGSVAATTAGFVGPGTGASLSPSSAFDPSFGAAPVDTSYEPELGVTGNVAPVADAGVAVVPVEPVLDAGLCEPGALADDDGGVDPCADAGLPDAGLGEAGVRKDSRDASVLPGQEVGVDPDAVEENPFFKTADEPASTFALDVDGASYSLTRSGLRAGYLPEPHAVRIEEFLNYFHFHYEQPKGDDPLSLYAEMGACPWNRDHQLVLLGVQGQEVDVAQAPPANLVFLLDVSGSMSAANKLPLVQKGLRLMTRLLRAQDRVSIVTYAGTDRVVLAGVPGDQRETILAAIDALRSSGSTNGEGGITRAYELAHEHFIEGGNNRVLLATDGDFNVGISDPDELKTFIGTKRDAGIFLTLFGFGDASGSGNYKDETGEQLTNHGDGIYFYIDSEEEARRAFLHSASGSLITVAKDVKIQVEFNADRVRAYRLIGYENRLLANEDFANDNVDGGELGASLSMTALYEVIPAGSQARVPEPRPGSVPEVESQADRDSAQATRLTDAELGPVTGKALFEVRLRYEGTDGGPSKLIRTPYGDDVVAEQPTAKWTFAATLAELAMQLRHSQYIPTRSHETLASQLETTLSVDKEGAVREVIHLMDLADGL